MTHLILVSRLKLFSKAFLAQHQLKLLFIIIWLHISGLNLMFITYHGPVFLWQENLQPITVLVHLLIALATTTLYWLLSNKFHKNKKCHNKMGTKLDAQSNNVTSKTK